MPIVRCMSKRMDWPSSVPTTLPELPRIARPAVSMRVRKAHQVQKAASIIRQAYGLRPARRGLFHIRYELLGTDVAVAVIRDLAKDETSVKVARRLPDG